MSADCPPLEVARQLAHGWALGDEPDPRLLRWVRVCMDERWDGRPCGSILTTGHEMAWHVGMMLKILLKVRPVGAYGIIPLCERAGWPRAETTT